MPNRNDIIREQTLLKTNCRPINLSFRNTELGITEYSSDRSKRKLEFHQDLLEWCNTTRKDECNLMTAQSIYNAHENSPALSEKLNTVLIITNNYPWQMGIGLLQRLYQPYFGMTIFCGTWRPRRYNDNGNFPDIVFPFNFIHISKSEMADGALSYYCLTKVAELRLQNVRGYFVQSDDTVFNFWRPLNLDKIIHPYGISYLGKPGAWWKKPYGKIAAKRVMWLFSKKYRNHKNRILLWEEYQRRLYDRNHITDAGQNLIEDDGWIHSDFYFIPQKEVQFFADLTEIFFEGRLFIEIAMNKYMRSVDFYRFLPYNFTYLHGKRPYWNLFYREDLVMLHPIKLSQFTNMNKRAKFCSTIVRTMEKVLLCSSDEYQRPVKQMENAGKSPVLMRS